jgi:hypothetical protein
MPQVPQEKAKSESPKRDAFVTVLLCLTGYCVISSFTLPFINSIWLGELPLLALIQLPKLIVAGWLRKDVVMEAIHVLGLSKGSFSPDFVLARPYALAIAYLVPLILIAVISWWKYRSLSPRRRPVLAGLFVAAAIDFVVTLIFADGRYLTIY